MFLGSFGPENSRRPMPFMWSMPFPLSPHDRFFDVAFDRAHSLDPQGFHFDPRPREN
jgi:hypothetical protein